MENKQAKDIHTGNPPGSQPGKQITPTKRSALVGFITFIILAFLISAFIYQRYRNFEEEQKESALAVANNVRARLQESLAYSLSATNTLSFCVRNDGTLRNFDSIAGQILETSKYIDALQLVPDGVIQHVYPVKGNEAVIGYDILRDPLRNKEAYKAIGKKEMFFAGPLKLRQGGVGVVGRLPIFRNNKFWGFTAVIIRMETLLKAAGIDSSGKNGYYFQLSKVNPDSKEDEFFIQHSKNIPLSHSVSVNVPNGEWKLSVIPMHPYKNLADIIMLCILGLLLSVLGGIFAFHESNRPKKLNDLVKERTMQLKESEENYKILFENSPLPLWIYDLETLKVIEVNNAAISLYGYTRDEFVNMDLRYMRPSEDINKFVEEAYRDRDNELREVGTWTHLKKNKEPIQVLIFSRNINYKGKDGRLVLVMDVSEMVKVENELKKSEEKYRSLIEQTSDGIILYSFDGTIHSFNKAAYTQTGYTQEEFELLNLKDLFYENVTAGMQKLKGKTNTGTTTLYRKLKRKDGSLFTVELNARMLPDGKIIAMVRDITEREKTEATIKASEEKYRSLIERVTDAFISLDRTGNFTYVNQRAGEIYKIKPETLIGKNIWKEFPDGIDRAFFNKCETAMKTQEYQYLEEYYPPLERWFENHIYPSKDGFTVLFKDVTEIKKALAERKKNEDQLRYQARLLESVSDAITSLDIERRIVSWNQACNELYGFTAEEVMGKRIPELVTFEYPYTTNEAAFKEVFTRGQWKGEFNFIHPKTNVKTHLLSSINLLKDTEGNINGFIITSRDITDRKKAEEEVRKYNERFELIAQATNDAVWDHDLVKNETWGNEKLYRLYGLEYGKDKINLEMFLSQIHPDERAGIEQRMKDAIENHDATISEEFRFKTPDGKYRSFYDRAHIKYDADAKPIQLLGAMQDITEKEIIRQQILKEKGLSDSIINSLPGIFYLYNKEGKFLRWNENFETVTGYTTEEIAHMHPLDFFEEKDKELLTAKISNVFVVGSDYVEADFLLKNKKTIPYYFTGQAIEYEGETCLMGVGLDFSEKEKAARIIRESEEKFRTIIEQAADGIFLADKDSYIIDVNSSGCRMLGYTKEELMKIKYTHLIPPGDLAKKPVMKIELESGTTVVNERRLVKKDGSYIDVEISAKVLFDGRYQSIIRDITERKKAGKALQESEERYRALVENAPEALVVYDVEKGTFISVSESAKKLFKMTEEELLKIGPAGVSAAYQSDGTSSLDAVKAHVQKAIEGEKPVFEWIHCDKDGKPIPCEVWLVRLPSENRILIRGSIIDITERKKAAEEIRVNSELLRELYSYSQNIREEERTYIAREIHDELGQQLTGLKMDLAWIKRKVKSTDTAVNEKIAGTLDLIDATVQSVRKIATELRPSILDDLGLVAALEWQGDEFGKRSGCEVNFTSHLKEMVVEPDTATAIFRIYQELLTNVARHAHATEVNTSIYIEYNKLHLSVEDNGTGFDIDHIVSKKTLGLRGIKERTNLIGGTYEIKSETGKGTFVLISVPL